MEYTVLHCTKMRVGKKDLLKRAYLLFLLSEEGKCVNRLVSAPDAIGSVTVRGSAKIESIGSEEHPALGRYKRGDRISDSTLQGIILSKEVVSETYGMVKSVLVNIKGTQVVYMRRDKEFGKFCDVVYSEATANRSIVGYIYR